MQNEPKANGEFSPNLKNGSNTVAKKSKVKRKNKCDLGPDFIAPDGGWGWLVVVAAGVSNLCCLPVLQQFGLLFGDRLKSIGLTASQITTIINLNSCLTSCIGLANGPMFRKYTFRLVGLFGAILIALSILLMTISDSFITYVLTFCVLYGIGSGINASANSLALNTYFKEKRRIATGLSWTITGMGPIVMPQIIAVILPLYGVNGSLYVYACLALIAAICSLIYQPVQWHVKKSEELTGDNPPPPEPILNECEYCALAKRNKRRSTTCRRRSSNLSVSTRERDKQGSSDVIVEELLEDDVFSTPPNGTPTCLTPTSLTSTAIQMAFGQPPVIEKQQSLIESKSRKSTMNDYCTCEDYRCFYADPQVSSELDEEGTKKYTLWQKIVKFFDLDLLRDFTYVNLMVGVTLGNFAEMNFSILTPFVLADWNFAKTDIATFMSILGGVDISVRFCIPFIADKIGWENKTFYLVGIMGMAMGRVFIAFFQSYWCILAAFCWIGLGKGLRTVFMVQVIPSHVPLHRLPAASGLQLLFAGIVYFIMGPVIGYIRDQTNYIVTLHCLNVATYCVATCWLLEKFYRDYQARNSKITDQE